MALVSIITGLYNSEPYLDAYFAALQAQTCRDWEAILVDDGSRDATVARVEAEAARDPRYKLIKKTPEGLPSRSRQKGLEAASGTYVAFVDHDDLWAAPKLAMQVAVMQAFPDTAILHTDRLVLQPGEAPPPFSRSFAGPADLPELPVEEQDPAAVIYGGLRIIFSSFMTSRALLNAVGGLHPELKGVDDFYLFVKLSPRGKIRHIALPLTYYAAHQGNLSHTQDIFVRGLKQVSALLVHDADVPEVAKRAIRAQECRTEAVALFAVDRPRALALLVRSLRMYFIPSTLNRLAFLLATFFVPLSWQRRLMARVKQLKFAFPTLRDVLVKLTGSKPRAGN